MTVKVLIIEKADLWDLEFGKVGAVIRDGEHLYAGADPRGETTAAGQ
jgi:hypothetical protein